MRTFTDRLRNRDSDGVGTMQLTLGAFLSLIVMFALMFGMSQLFIAKNTGVAAADTAITVGGVNSGLTGDISKASAIRITNSNTIDIARSDAKCVRWTVVNQTEAGKKNGTVTRYVSNSGAIQANNAGSKLMKDIRTGDFTKFGSGGVKMKLLYGNTGELVVQGSPDAISKGAGTCW